MSASSGVGAPPGPEAVRVDIRSLIPGKRYTFYQIPTLPSHPDMVYKFRATFDRIEGLRIFLKDITEETQPDGSPTLSSRFFRVKEKIIPISNIDFVTDISFDTRVGRNIPKEIGSEIGKFLGGKRRRYTRKSKTQKAGRRSRASVKRIKRSKH